MPIIKQNDKNNCITINKEYYNTVIVDNLNRLLPNRNKYSLPSLISVKITCGYNKKKNFSDHAAQRVLNQISGQYASFTKAKKSINNFGIGEGNIVGVQVTLRKTKMFDILHSLIYVVLPSINNFKGFSIKALQGHKNIYTLSFGIKDVAVFHWIDMDSRMNMGCNINIAVKANSPEEAHLLLSQIGIPIIEPNQIQEQSNG